MMAQRSQLFRPQGLAALTTMVFLLARCSVGEAATVAATHYSMASYEDCYKRFGILKVPRGQTTFLNERGSDNGQDVTDCRLWFKPKTAGDNLTVEVMGEVFLAFPGSTLHVELDGQVAVFGVFSDSADRPKFEARDGLARIDFTRESMDDTTSRFLIAISASKYNPDIEDQSPSDNEDNEDTENDGPAIIFIIVGSLASVAIFFFVFTCCWMPFNSRKTQARQCRGAQYLRRRQAGAVCFPQSRGNNQGISFVSTFNPTMRAQQMVRPPPYPGHATRSNVIPTEPPPPYAKLNP